MSKSTHTPGPWNFQYTDESGECFIIAANLGGMVGASLPWPTEIETRDFRRVIANARLMAAAPDLLSALEALTAEAHKNMVGGMGHLIDDARAAISRASLPHKES